jgi:hypothetical protein
MQGAAQKASERVRRVTEEVNVFVQGQVAKPLVVAAFADTTRDVLLHIIAADALVRGGAQWGPQS